MLRLTGQVIGRSGRLARHMSSAYGPAAPPINLGVHIVPQQSAYVVERFGRFNKVLHAGIHVLFPLVDRVAYVHVLKEVRCPTTFLRGSRP